MQKVGENLFASWGVGHFRMELKAVNVLLADHGVGTVFRGGHGFESLGQTGDPVPVAVPDFQIFGQAFEQRGGSAAMQDTAAVFTPGATSHLAPKLLHQKLHPVTDAEDGNAKMEDAPVHFGRLRGVHAGRAAAENDSLGPEGEDFPHGDGVGNDLGIDVGFADPPGDDLGVLGAEIEDQDPFLDSVGTR